MLAPWPKPAPAEAEALFVERIRAGGEVPELLSAVALTVRVSFGILLALFLAALGLVFGWFVTPPTWPTLPTGLLLTCCGVGAGLGGFISFFKPEAAYGVHAMNLSIALAGGLVGAWAGWGVGGVLYPEGVYNPAAPIRTPPFMVSVIAASAGSNAASWALYAYRLLRYREI